MALDLSLLHLVDKRYFEPASSTTGLDSFDRLKKKSVLRSLALGCRLVVIIWNLLNGTALLLDARTLDLDLQQILL